MIRVPALFFTIDLTFLGPYSSEYGYGCIYIRLENARVLGDWVLWRLGVLSFLCEDFEV